MSKNSIKQTVQASQEWVAYMTKRGAIKKKKKQINPFAFDVNQHDYR
tara:strand:- start:1342 stop:1482 length:141 start_codon:yes stop_codon:yes gene_type:complete